MKRSLTAFWLCLVYAVFVVYGSLVPLEFEPLPLDQAWQAFQHIPYLALGLDSRADWVANGVLYAPLAFFAARAALQRGWAAAWAIGVSWLACTALAVGVEFTQLFFPQRTVSQNDVIAEALGSALGALAAPLFARWVDRLSGAWAPGGGRLLRRLLEAYTAAYVALSFFPYDLLLSAAELQGKAQSASWGWVLAPNDGGLSITALHLVLEVALALPVGLLWARRHGTRASASQRSARIAGTAVRWPGWRPAAAGLLLGLVIEGGQFFVSSGISQGASVASRAVGVVAGAALAPWLGAVGLGGLRARLGRLALPLAFAYLPLLALLSGLFTHRWQGVAEASAGWHTLHLLPFYYHYFTSEALALSSLCSIALLYLPVALLGWAAGWRARRVVGVAALLSAGVEACKLFLAGLHPDPTDVLIAVATAALVLKLLSAVQRSPAALPESDADVPPAVASAVPVAVRRSHLSAGLLVLPAAAAWALAFPVLPGTLAALLAACAAAVWRWPLLALALLPAALPVFDLAPWSGRFYADEFDLLSAVCLAVAFHRATASAATVRPPRRLLTLAFALLGTSLAVSSWRALASAGPFWPPGWPDANSFTSYTSPWNALRIVKGALWAWLFVRLWQRLDPAGPGRARCFSAGMLAGLAATVALLLYERAVFASVWDVAADFRVSGPISAMHKGGAYIECWLAVAAAFALSTALCARSVPARLGALVLLGGACYGVMVTYSRNGYAALAVVLLVVLVPMLMSARGGVDRRGQAPQAGRWRPVAWAALTVVVVAAVALPIAAGPFARQRLQQSGSDLAVRAAHWADGLALRDDSALTTLFGMGLGRFPDAHFWRSQEPVHAASFRLARDGETPLLRLGQGATLYIEQIIARPAQASLRLTFDVRAAPGSVARTGVQPQLLPTLAVELCEKWLLTSRHCVSAVDGPPPLTGAPVASSTTPAVPAPPSAALAPPQAGAWRHVERRLDASTLLAENRLWRAPLTLSLLTPAEGVIDVARVQLLDPGGDDLLANGDIAHGLDRWFFTTDVDPPWHLHSLPVAVLFDQGWLGVLAWSAVLLGALGSGAVLVWRGQAQLPAALAAAAGFLASGTLNTLIDAPRFLWLLLVLLWLAAARA